MSDGDYKYWAFISYSHEDKAWGDWLHKSLETYRVPKRLVGRQTGDTAVPKRLFPIFRDREELPSSADLSNNINVALSRSRYLVVICSPRAAVSRWVNEEIKSFKRQGRENRILALIVDGEPNASDKSESGKLECFPPSLRHRVSAEGELLPDRVETIAADLRPGKDGKSNARLKLLAGLLGVPYDELRQREKQRQRLRKIQWAAGVLLCAVLVGSAWIWQAHRKATQLAIAQDTEQGRVLYLDNKPLQASVYLAEAYRLGGRSPALLFLLARTMHYVDALQYSIASPSLSNRRINADLSPDGRWLAFSGADEDTGVWSVATGRKAFSTLEPGLVQVDPIFSQSGKYLVIVSRPTPMSPFESIRVLDPTTGAVVSRFGNPNIQATVGNNPDLDVVDTVVGPNDVIMLRHGTADDIDDIHELSTGKRLARLDGHGVIMQFARFSPDGKSVARVSQNDKSLTLWDASTGRKRDSFRGEGFPTFNFDMNTDGTRLATANNDGVVRIWDMQSGRGLFVLNDPRNPKTDAAYLDAAGLLSYTPDGARLVTGGARAVQLWDATQGALLARLGQVKLTSLKVKYDGNLIMGSTADNATLIWDARNYELVGSLPGDWSFFAPRGDSLVTFSDPDNMVQVWDGSKTITAQSTPMRTLAFSPDESKLATWDASTINVRDARSGTVLFSIPTDIDFSQFPDPTFRPDVNVVFSPDSKRLLALREGYEYSSAQVAGSVRLWDVTNGSKLADLKGHGTLLATSYSQDGRAVFTCEDDNTGALWDGNSGASLSVMTIPSGCLAARLAPTGTQAAVLHSGGRQFSYRYDLWDLKAQHLLTALPEEFGSSWSLAYSPDGQSLATADNQGVIRVRDLSKNATLRSWDSGSGSVRQVVYSPDGGQLATVHASGIIKVWAMPNGALLWQHKSESSNLDIAGYSADGRFLLMNDGSSGWSLLDASSGVVLMRAGGNTLPGTISIGQISPSNKWLISKAGDRSVLLDIGSEQRPPSEILSLVECRVPWQLAGGQLLPARPKTGECPAGGESQATSAHRALGPGTTAAPSAPSGARPAAVTKHEKTAALPSLQEAQAALSARRIPEAFREFKVLAEHSDPKAESYLATMYATGLGTTQNFERAAHWYEQAAAQGDAGAELDLGRMYEAGSGVSKDYTKAAELYQRAFKHGSAEAASLLGNLYVSGRGVEQSYLKAADYYQKSIDLGYTAAENSLGTMYLQGFGVPKNYVKAKELLQKATDHGNSDAETTLGMMYGDGLGVSRNYDKSMELFRDAAAKGSVRAEKSLAKMYQYGLGVTPSASNAAKWWAAAANQGDAEAEYNLAVVYEASATKPEDFAAVREWYEKSAAQGYEDAIKALQRLRTQNPFESTSNSPPP